MLGIIGAMDGEIEALRREMTGVSEAGLGFARCFQGTLRGVPVCLARCGVGKVHAALCAQAMILRWKATEILNIGVAGALRDSLAVGDIVIAGSAAQHDIDTTPIGDPPGLISGPNIVHVPCDEHLSALLLEAAAQTGLRVERAAIVTGDQFVVGEARKDALAQAFGAAACDMEGGAVAQCCYELGVPYAACRAISDTRLGDGREYAQKAGEACRAVEKLMRRFLFLYRQSKKGEENG